MTTSKQIEKEKQLIARYDKSLVLEKLKKRRLDTRRKIELGGLVIKSGITIHDKSILLGALTYAKQLIEQDSKYEYLFKSIGDKMLLN
ncbi:TPA: conjugal transfer protein TraD [Legionella pneumophila]|nr:conjugal transfer protein TraD [Legionella pneumophila]